MTTTPTPDPLDEILAKFSVAKDYPAEMYEESKAKAKAALTAHIKTVCEEAIEVETHYGCSANDEEFLAGDDPSELCCECYPHKSCKINPAIEKLKAAQRSRLQSLTKEEEKE